ncbi:MAG: radical SAM protein, partial [Nitrososphaeria archaeon]
RNVSRFISYHLLDGLAPLPSKLYININSKCNMKCKMCDYGQRRKTNFSLNLGLNIENELDAHTWGVFIDELKSFKPTIAITGTEPLLFPNLIEFIEKCKRNRLKIEITTNGYLLPEYARDLVKMKIDKICISIDGPEAIHNNIRGTKDAFAKAKEGILKILESRQYKKPTISINYTISSMNYYCLEETLLDLGGIYDSFIFSHLNFITKEMADKHNKLENICPVTSSTISDLIDPKKVDISILNDQIKKVKKKYSNVYFNPDLDKSQLSVYYHNPTLFIDGFDRCYIPWLTGQILANGDFVISTRCFRIIFGNITKQKFKEIWNAESLVNFRKKIKKIGAFPACARCCGIFSSII